jgi:hypothetical protein
VGIGIDTDDPNDGIPANVPTDHLPHYLRVRDLRRKLVGAPHRQ